MAESEEELKSLLKKVKEESEKVGLKLNIQKMKIMASGPITSWEIDGETVETVSDFILLLLLLLSHFSRVRLCATSETVAHQAPRPWDSPGKNTGVGCHFLFQRVKVKSLSRVQPSATPWTAAFQAPPSMGFSRQEYWRGVPLPSPQTLFWGAPKSLQMVSAAMKLKDTYSLEGKL